MELVGGELVGGVVGDNGIEALAVGSPEDYCYQISVLLNSVLKKHEDTLKTMTSIKNLEDYEKQLSKLFSQETIISKNLQTLKELKQVARDEITDDNVEQRTAITENVRKLHKTYTDDVRVLFDALSALINSHMD